LSLATPIWYSRREKNMAAISASIENIRHLFGHEVGVSDWSVIDQQQIDNHAQSTGDDSWMHTDPERTAAESPFGCTIAQSFLVLAHLTDMVAAVEIPIPGIVYRQNYGFDRVRIVQPVKVDRPIRTEPGRAKGAPRNAHSPGCLHRNRGGRHRTRGGRRVAGVCPSGGLNRGSRPDLN
ncbi:MAG: MaoC/PaaZ C-terminal domain-containing protein, partial [Pseudomonadales bacterium]